MNEKKQNISHAVMARRHESLDSLDDFPTPPWATRALLTYCIEQGGYTNFLSCMEPACGRGYMSRPLSEYFGSVYSMDIHNYGFGQIGDFLRDEIPDGSYDWLITNPPFRLAEEFVLKALPIARRGVAILARTVFIESVGRYERIFQRHPPTIFAQFTERVPMVKGRVDPKASTATGYAWIVWEKGSTDHPRLMWIPRSRKKLERSGDYDDTNSPFFVSNEPDYKRLI